jgi:hypothetical protein
MMNRTNPYCIEALFDPERGGDLYHSSTFWCRIHKRVEKGNWAMGNCARIGPFVDDKEAKAVGEAIYNL